MPKQIKEKIEEKKRKKKCLCCNCYFCVNESNTPIFDFNVGTIGNELIYKERKFEIKKINYSKLSTIYG